MKKIAAACLLALLCLASVAWASDDSTSQVNKLPVKGVVTLIDLGAASCIPCKMMAPILEELKGQYAGKAEVHFIDVRHDRAAIDRFKLRGIPTQIFFDREGKEAYRHLGFLDKEAIVTIMAQLGVK